MKYTTFLALTLICSACGKNVRDECLIQGNQLVCPKEGTSTPISVPGADGTNGTDGTDGTDANPCIVTDTEEGALIICPDGSSVELHDGEDGRIVVCHRHHGHRVCAER